MLDLEPIKARLARATPGQWIYRNTQESDLNRPICEIEYVSVVPIDENVAVLPYGQDLDLIVNAPRDLAALIAEVEQLRQWKFAHTRLVEYAHEVLDRIDYFCRQEMAEKNQKAMPGKAIDWSKYNNAES